MPLLAAELSDAQTVITDSKTDSTTIDALREVSLNLEIAK